MSSTGPGNAIANSNLVWRIVDDEALILDLSSGVYFSLNPVATDVWQGLQSGASVSAVVAEVAHKYGVDVAIVREDVRQFMEDLKQAKLWDQPKPNESHT